MSLSGTKVRIKAIGGGMCAPNAFILAIRDYIVTDTLDAQQKSFEPFIIYLQKNFSHLKINTWKNFKDYFKNTNSKDLQTNLTQAFREFAIHWNTIDSRRKADYSIKLRTESHTALKNYIFNQLGIKTPQYDDEDLLKFEAIGKESKNIYDKYKTKFESAKDDKEKETVKKNIEEDIDKFYLDWWDSAGFEENLKSLKQPTKWLTEKEIYALGDFWNVDVLLKKGRDNIPDKADSFFGGETILPNEKIAYALYQPGISIVEGHPYSVDNNIYKWSKITNKEELLSKLQLAVTKGLITKDQLSPIVTAWEKTYKAPLGLITIAFVSNNHWDPEVDINIATKFKDFDPTKSPSLESSEKSVGIPPTPSSSVTKSAAPAVSPIPSVTDTSSPKTTTTSTTPLPATSTKIVTPATDKPKQPSSPRPNSTTSTNTAAAPAQPATTTPIIPAGTPPVVPPAPTPTVVTPPATSTTPPPPVVPTKSITPPTTPPPVTPQQPIKITRTDGEINKKEALEQTTCKIFSELLSSKKIKQADRGAVVEKIIESKLAACDVITNLQKQVYGFRLPKAVILKEDSTTKSTVLSSVPSDSDRHYCPTLTEGSAKTFSIATGAAKGIELKAECKGSALSISVDKIPPDLEEKLKNTQTISNGTSTLTLPSNESLSSADNLLQTVLAGNLEENSDKNKIKICTKPDDEVKKQRIKALILLCEANGLVYEDLSGLNYKPAPAEIDHVKSMIKNQELTDIADNKKQENEALRQKIEQLKTLADDKETNSEDKKTAEAISGLVEEAIKTSTIDSNKVSEALSRFTK